MTHDRPSSLESLSSGIVNGSTKTSTCQYDACCTPQKNEVAQVFDLLDYGVLCVDDVLRVTFMNACAQELCQQNDGLSICHERLVVSMSHEIITLQEIMKRPTSFLHREKGVVKVSRPSLRRPFEIVIIPGICVAAQRQTRASMLLVFDPDKRIKVRPELISQLYGLTSAESRLAIILLQGKTLDEASSTLCRAKETVRKQLQSIFDKTNTSRQSELLRLLLRGPASLRL